MAWPTHLQQGIPGRAKSSDVWHKTPYLPWEAQVKVDRSICYSPSIFQWSGGLIEFQWQWQLSSQWISSQAIHGAIQIRKEGNQPSWTSKSLSEKGFAGCGFTTVQFVNFVNFQVFSILLILVFDLKSCFYVCFNCFEWSQVEEISRRLKEKKSGRNWSRNRAKTGEKQSSAKFHNMKETSAKWAFCCQTIPQHCRSLCEGISQLRKWGLAHECHSAVQ